MDKHLTLKEALLLVLSFTAIVLSIPSWANAATSPTNTETNLRDHAYNEVTADQQSWSKSDTEISRSIRQSLIKDKNLSYDAHNIKIITVDGEVTLKGPVRTHREQQAIENTAKKVAGVSKVIDEIDVINDGDQD